MILKVDMGHQGVWVLPQSKSHDLLGWSGIDTREEVSRSEFPITDLTSRIKTKFSIVVFMMKELCGL